MTNHYVNSFVGKFHTGDGSYSMPSNLAFRGGGGGGAVVGRSDMAEDDRADVDEVDGVAVPGDASQRVSDFGVLPGPRQRTNTQG